MNPIVNTDAATLSPIALFLQADWVVKGVMLGLLLASIWTWAIIVMFWLKVGRTRKATETFERDFWKAEDIDAFYKSKGNADLPSARVLAAGVAEWRRSTQGQVIDREGTRDRLATTMGAAVAKEIDELSDRLNVLATVGSVAPFVGLFGTVWGIHNISEYRWYQYPRLSRISEVYTIRFFNFSVSSCIVFCNDATSVLANPLRFTYMSILDNA